MKGGTLFYIILFFVSLMLFFSIVFFSRSYGLHDRLIEKNGEAKIYVWKEDISGKKTVEFLITNWTDMRDKVSEPILVKVCKDAVKHSNTNIYTTVKFAGIQTVTFDNGKDRGFIPESVCLRVSLGIQTQNYLVKQHLKYNLEGKILQVLTY
jgi:hypothetical protein